MAEILISKYDFEGFPCNEDHDYIYEDENEHNFIGFDVNSDFNFKTYTDKFIKMLQNFKENHLELNNEDDLIPKPLEDLGYIVVENGSRNGKDLIKDSCGYNYSYWRETGSKNKTKHFRCIKRHRKGIPDCTSILKVINYKEENMKVSPTNEHNHQPDFALNLKRDINMDLKRECMEKSLEHPCKVIHNVS